jgi:hypothetical protein
MKGKVTGKEIFEAFFELDAGDGKKLKCKPFVRGFMHKT